MYKLVPVCARFSDLTCVSGSRGGGHGRGCGTPHSIAGLLVNDL